MVFVNRRLRSSAGRMSRLFRTLMRASGEFIHSRRDMLLHVIVRFVLAIVGSLAAFYLCILYLHAAGQITPYQMQHVNWFFTTLL